jgi:hypothetical protein
MKLFWQAYYKVKLGSGYEAIINNAKHTMRYTTSATAGKVSIFYNSNGECIRGWHKTPVKFKSLNPLVEYYASK